MSNDKFNGDSRLKKDSGAEHRGSRENADASRVNDDGGSLSAAERRQALRQGWVHEVLPSPPPIPGFHMCWLSTTNSTDPIHKRVQLGYVPVKAAELPGFEQYKISDGQFEGCVACNEMILFKLPADVYQDLMAIYHADMPLEQEASIRERVMNTTEQDSDGRRLGSVEGNFNSLGVARGPTPKFHG